MIFGHSIVYNRFKSIKTNCFQSFGFCRKWYYAEVISYNRKNLARELQNKSRQQAAQDKVKEKAILMLQKGKISIDEVQTFFPELSDVEIEEVKGEIMPFA